MEKEEIMVQCNICEQRFAVSSLERYCSNCFGCTGCERYICPNCNELIIVKGIKPPNWD